VRPVSVGVEPVATVNTTVYTTPTGYYAKMNLMYIHNAGSGSKYVTVQWFDSSASVTHEILNQYTMNAKEYLQFNGGAYIVLEEGDQIRVETESGSVFTFIGTFEETGLTRQ
jgi:hypothetical protein